MLVNICYINEQAKTIPYICLSTPSCLSFSFSELFFFPSLNKCLLVVQDNRLDSCKLCMNMSTCFLQISRHVNKISHETQMATQFPKVSLVETCANFCRHELQKETDPLSGTQKLMILHISKLMILHVHLMLHS